ncbi:TPA: hypothetical protein ACJIWU_004277 [Enterobacter chengduensis]|uniref:Uncharacterized protein n=1 Tax=Enterobacter chengduensis TaxID=2494701 RepID=A0AAW3HCD9_9ENTR|nr:hypothetical protein [Enterobacter chengduensis]KDF49844.1 hypothetical protein AE07_01231 [Enterobacter cloacae BWH 43]OTW35063.1 hypothetical protein CAP57_10625 [Enterobacter kobei]KJX32637.1 hypothetical protein SG71_19485 [Enterobacter chengduensis]MBN9880309.1 hypothetical protein [Enterobacter chengduensis]MCM7520039.1 hypothetical protein [Enterobacter chengduensis]
MKSYLSYIGSVLVLVGIYFVYCRFIGYFNEINSVDLFSLPLLITLTGSAIIYAIINVFLVMAWRNILNIYSVNISIQKAFKIYSSSQLAKYVPGNIFHLAGRQVISMQFGLPTKPVMKSIVAELICLVITGALFSLWYLPYIFTKTNIKDVIVLFCVLLSVATYFVFKFSYQKWFWIIIQQSLFLIFSGLIFYVIIIRIDNHDFELSDMVVVVSSYIAAWLIGMITPGAPAGVGVREAILLFLLYMFSPANVLIAIVYSRIVTVLGDFIFYVASYVVKVTSNEL